MRYRDNPKGEPIRDFDGFGISVPGWKAVRNRIEDLKQLSRLSALCSGSVGKHTTTRSESAFPTPLFRQEFRAKASSIILSAFVGIALLIFTVTCGADDLKNDVGSRSSTISRNTLKTIIVPDYYPYTFMNDQGKPDGFSVDLARAVVQAMDMKLEIEPGTWERAKGALENGTIDFLPMMAASPLRRQSFDFSAPHTVAYDSAFVRRGNQTASSLNDLSGKSVIVMNKDAAHDVIAASPSSETMKLTLVDSLPDALRLLAAGDGDAVIMPRLVGLLLVKKLGITHVEASPATIGAYNRPFSFAVKKGNIALIEALGQGLSIVKANGEYREIYDKWFGVLAPPGLPRELVLKYIAGIVVASTLVGALLLAWSLSLKRLVKQRTETLESEISSRKKAEAALRQSEERYRGIFENAALGIDVVDSNGKFIEVNGSLAEMLGYTRGELLNLTFMDVSHPDDVEVSRFKHEKMVRGESKGYRFEKRYIRKDGRDLWADVSVSQILGPDETYGATVVVISDITEHKKAEEALRRLNRELQAITSCNQTLLRAENELTLLNEICHIICDEAGYRLAWVGYAEQDEAKTIRPVAWAGFDSGYIPDAKLSWADDAERGRGPAGIVIRSGETVCVQDFTTDPRMVPWRESALQRGYRSGIALPLKDEGANVFGALLIYHSESNIITPEEIRLMEQLADDLAFGVNTLRDRVERKKAEEALRSSEDKYKAVVENIQIGISLLSPNLEIVDINKVFEQYFPHVRPGSGQICYEQYNDPPRSEPCSYCPCILTLQDGKVHEAITETPAGPGIRNFHVISSPIKDSDGHIQFVIEMVEDITERKRVEKALRDSEERLRMTLEASQIGIWDWDVKTDQWYASPTYYTMLGYEPKAGLADRSEWLERVHPDDRPFVKATIQSVLDGTFTEYQYKARLRHADGTYRWQLAQGMSVQRDEDGKVTRMLGIRMDVDQRKRSEDALRASSAYNRRLIEASLDPLVTISAEGKITDVNTATEKVTGCSRDELIGTDFSLYFTDLEKAKSGYQQVFMDGSVRDYELEIRHKDGRLTPVMYNASVYRDDSGEVLGVFAAARDISDRKRAEERNLRLAAIVESSDDAIIGKTLDGIITSWNRGAEKIYGYKETEAVGKSISLLVPPDRQVEIPQILERIRAGEHVEHFETVRRKKDGSEVHVSLTLSPIRSPEGNIIGASTIARDVTERKRVEIELQKLALVVHNSREFIALSDLDGRLIFINEAGARMVGISQEKVRARVIQDVVPESYQDFVRTKVIPEILEKGHWDGFLQLRHIETGELTDVQAMTFLIRDLDTGQPLYLANVSLDITERRKAEEALRKNEQILGSLVNGNPESLFMIDTEGIVLVANDEMARRLGTTVSELIGSSVYDFIPTDIVQTRKEYVQQAIRTGKPVRFEDSRLGRTIDNNIEPIVDEQGKVISLAILGIDITNLRKAEEAQKRLATAIEQSAEVVVITDPEGVIQYVNPITERITGFEKSELIGNTPRIFKSGEHDRAFYEQLWNTIRAGKVWSGRFINKKKDGIIYHEDATISPVRDASGKIVNFVAVKRDMTDHLNLSRQLFQAQKMEAVGTLAGGIAHDFNNLLQVMLGYSELILADEDLPDRLKEDMEKVFLAGRNGSDLVQRLLTFSRKTESKPLDLDLNQRIRQTHKFLQRTIPKMIDIELILADDLARIHADPTHIDQVLMNLSVNARDAMPEGGKLVIETTNVVLDEEYSQTHFGSQPGEYVLLSVSDSGPGMDKETLDHVFEPFFTTKEAGKGTGLGLAMVYGIVKQHDGYITCYSELGRGTTFKIYMPIAETKTESDEATPSEMPAFGTETILLADDEEFIRDLGTRILERSGYTVLTAANGREALDLYRREKEKISLAILDLIMPAMGGKQCLEELLQIDPNARVLIASGFAATGETKEAIETGAKGFVSKPYNVKQLLQAVREALDAK